MRFANHLLVVKRRSMSYVRFMLAFEYYIVKDTKDCVFIFLLIDIMGTNASTPAGTNASAAATAASPCKFHVPTYRCSRNKGTTRFAAENCKLNTITNRCVLKNRPPAFSHSKNVLYSDRVSKFPLEITKIVVPKLDALITQVKRIVDDNWDNVKLETRGTFDSINERNKFKDMFTKRTLASDHGVLMIGEDSAVTSADAEHKKNNKRQLQSIASDFNNLYFLRKNTRLKFLFIIVSAYNAMIQAMYAKDRSLTVGNLNIIFKGGNMYRVIIQQIIREFNQRNENYLQEKFKNYIKEGDFDFEIVSYKLENNKIVKINVIVQLVILAMRNWLLRNNIFDFLSDSVSTKRKKLNALLNKFTQFTRTIKSGDMKDVTIDYVQAGDVMNTPVTPAILSKYKQEHGRPDGDDDRRTDFAIITNASNAAVSRDENLVGLMKTINLLKRYSVPTRYAELALESRRNGSDMYCSFNSSVRFKTHDALMSFSLSRIKYNYIMYFHKTDTATGVQTYHKRDVPGEILDISHRFNEDFKKLQNPLHKEEKLEFYRVRNTDVSFYSMSMNGAMHDHESIILTASADAPWTMPTKYKKRLYRTIIMYIFLLLTEERYHIRSKIDWLATLIKEVRAERFTPTPSKSMNRMKSTFIRIQNKKLVGNGYAGYKKTLLGILEDILAAISSQYGDTRNQVFRLNAIDI